jgi:hypothetical protein
MPLLAGNKKGGRYFEAALLCALSLGAPSAQGAGEILQGAAAIASAVSGIVTPAIKAQGEAAVAGIQAGASVAMTRIAADTSMYISTNNTNVALAQTYAAERINAYNQFSTTQRLDKQLSALREARESQASIERERLKNERELNDMRINLAYQQADANYKLAQMSLSSQLVQAGLSTGFARKNSGSELTSTALSLGNTGLTMPGQPSRLLASVGESLPTSAALPVARTSQIQMQPVGPGLAGTMSANGLVRGSSFGQEVRVASAAPMLQSDLANFQQSVQGPGEARAMGRSRSSVLVGAQQSGHTGNPVSGRPVLGRPSGRAFADR